MCNMRTHADRPEWLERCCQTAPVRPESARHLADFARLRACSTLGKHSNYTTTLFIENGIDSLPDMVMRNLNSDLRQ